MTAKLQCCFVGPFRVETQISRVAYKLELPEHWRVHPVFHSSLLKPFQQSSWGCPVEAPQPDVEVDDGPGNVVDRILRWRSVQRASGVLGNFSSPGRDFP